MGRCSTACLPEELHSYLAACLSWLGADPTMLFYVGYLFRVLGLLWCVGLENGFGGSLATAGDTNVKLFGCCCGFAVSEHRQMKNYGLAGCLLKLLFGGMAHNAFLCGVFVEGVGAAVWCCLGNWFWWLIGNSN